VLLRQFQFGLERHHLQVPPARRIKWLIFAVNEVKPGSPNIGLSEIAVF
jgi:hypothetical protein